MHRSLHLPPGGPPDRQRGVVLVVALIMLAVITLLGVSAMQVTSLEERMAGNMRDRSLAFQAAEAALRDGERLLTQVTLPAFDGTNGLYPAPAVGALPEWMQAGGSPQPASWWTTNGRPYGGTVAGVAAQPRYVIEEIARLPGVGESLEAGQPVPDITYYRVTARGVGGSATAVVVLQSTFRRL
ncbi:MAG: pilus assembly protein [Immundisolibacter sp.]